MRPENLILRCFAKRDGEMWVAVCVDLSLAAQADTPEHAREKLAEQIREYVFDALVGEDKEFGPQLLLRKAPLSQRLEYQYIRFLLHIHKAGNGMAQAFNQILPMGPAQTA